MVHRRACGYLGPLGIGAGGLLVGHWMSYVLAVPQAQHRHAVLALTGHSYLSVAAWFAGAATVFAASVVVARARSAVSNRGRWTSLVTLQIAGFVVLEVGERLAAGLGPLDLALPVVVGIGVQVVVALVAAVLLLGLQRLGEVLGVRLRFGDAPHPPESVPYQWPPVRLVVDRERSRAPPLRLVG